jgi:hypothetical protein
MNFSTVASFMRDWRGMPERFGPSSRLGVVATDGENQLFPRDPDRLESIGVEVDEPQVAAADDGRPCLRLIRPERDLAGSGIGDIGLVGPARYRRWSRRRPRRGPRRRRGHLGRGRWARWSRTGCQHPGGGRTRWGRTPKMRPSFAHRGPGPGVRGARAAQLRDSGGIEELKAVQELLAQLGRCAWPARSVPPRARAAVPARAGPVRRAVPASILWPGRVPPVGFGREG